MTPDTLIQEVLEMKQRHCCFQVVVIVIQAVAAAVKNLLGDTLLM
jgi:hypothetical protein